MNPSPTFAMICLACAAVCAWLAGFAADYGFVPGLLAYILAGFWFGVSAFEANLIWQAIKESREEQA